MRYLTTLLVFLAGQAAALDLSIPNATVVRTESSPAGQIRLPEEPWSADARPNVISGAIERQILRVPSSTRTTVQLLSDLRARLEEAGYSEAFSCADVACGGFDFRFQLDILGEPDMHVDLGDYLYVLMRATRPGIQPHSVALLASRSQAAGFVHITRISEASQIPDTIPPETETVDTTPAPAQNTDPFASLTETGHVVLSGLEFPSGSADLAGTDYPSLGKLAEWLGQNPTARIVLVGHTDSVGSLEANTALSRQRAASVARYLTDELGADPSQIQSSGVGYLSPVASNLTDEGRSQNRRVEAVVLSIDE